MKYLSKIKHLYAESGSKHNSLYNVLFSYIKHHVIEKWRFVYLEFDLKKKIFELPSPEELSIRISTEKDLARFKSDVFPHLTPNQGFDKRLIIGGYDSDMQIYIAERKNKIIHYFIFFKNALNSPLVDTPVNKRLLLNTDAYLGGTFTVPDARGSWIVAHVLQKILMSLKAEGVTQRVIMIVHPDTPGAIKFFEKMGFCKTLKYSLRYKKFFRSLSGS